LAQSGSVSHGTADGRFRQCATAPRVGEQTVDHVHADSVAPYRDY
jgi:hypothetical protein